jgi:ribosome-associated heat shock protein Hsp15
MRLDQWLWAVRIFKTRSTAAEAIKGGHVEINAQSCKPAREVKPGDIVVARVNEIQRTVRVVSSPPSRVGAKLVPEYLEDLTPPEEYQRRREPNFIPAILRTRGSGRPTKKDRRDLDAQFGI